MKKYLFLFLVMILSLSVLLSSCDFGSDGAGDDSTGDGSDGNGQNAALEAELDDKRQVAYEFNSAKLYDLIDEAVNFKLPDMAEQLEGKTMQIDLGDSERLILDDGLIYSVSKTDAGWKTSDVSWISDNFLYTLPVVSGEMSVGCLDLEKAISVYVTDDTAALIRSIDDAIDKMVLPNLTVDDIEKNGENYAISSEFLKNYIAEFLPKLIEKMSGVKLSDDAAEACAEIASQIELAINYRVASKKIIGMSVEAELCEEINEHLETLGLEGVELKSTEIELSYGATESLDELEKFDVSIKSESLNLSASMSAQYNNEGNLILAESEMTLRMSDANVSDSLTAVDIGVDFDLYYKPESIEKSSADILKLNLSVSEILGEDSKNDIFRFEIDLKNDALCNGDLDFSFEAIGSERLQTSAKIYYDEIKNVPMLENDYQEIVDHASLIKNAVYQAGALLASEVDQRGYIYLSEIDKTVILQTDVAFGKYDYIPPRIANNYCLIDGNYLKTEDHIRGYNRFLFDKNRELYLSKTVGTADAIAEDIRSSIDKNDRDLSLDISGERIYYPLGEYDANGNEYFAIVILDFDGWGDEPLIKSSTFGTLSDIERDKSYYLASFADSAHRQLSVEYIPSYYESIGLEFLPLIEESDFPASQANFMDIYVPLDELDDLGDEYYIRITYLKNLETGEIKMGSVDKYMMRNIPDEEITLCNFNSDKTDLIFTTVPRPKTTPVRLAEEMTELVGEEHLEFAGRDWFYYLGEQGGGMRAYITLWAWNNEGKIAFTPGANLTLLEGEPIGHVIVEFADADRSVLNVYVLGEE